MPAYIGRLSAIGLWKETTSWTAVAPTIWLPVTKSEMNPIIKNVEDTSGLGIIDKVSDSRPVENTSETSVEGIVRDNSFGALLHMLFGTVAAPTLVETGVYKHAFSRKNDNNPVSYTITEDVNAAAKQAPYSIVDSLTVEVKAGDYVRFTTKFVGGQLATTTDQSPSYTQEKLFLASGVTVKLNGTAIKAASYKITIEKNPEKYMALGSTNIDSIFNTIFTVKGDMELLYDSETILNLVIAGTKQSLELIATGTDLIGATKKSELEFLVPLASLEEWKRANDPDKIVRQTVAFKGVFDIATAKTISGYIQNTKAVSY